MTETLRVAVIGAGRMGIDHIQRLSHRIRGAGVSVVVDVDQTRAEMAVADLPDALALTDSNEALARADVDAVLVATPGFLHEDVLLKALGRDLPILCEKPLTPDVQSALRVVRAEEKLGRQRIQVGFMRRFDAEYAQLHRIISEQKLGELLMLHCTHRNPNTPLGFTNKMLINDSVVHEFDAVRFLTDEEITSVQVRLGKPSRNAPEGQHDPQHVLLETTSGVLADVEIYVNAQFGYEVATQAVFEQGTVNIGGDSGPYMRTAGTWGGRIPRGFEERFGAAYDVEVQAWVDATRRGTIGGPSAWDGYATAACCEAGVKAQKTGQKEAVNLVERPALYNQAREAELV